MQVRTAYFTLTCSCGNYKYFFSFVDKLTALRTFYSCIVYIFSIVSVAIAQNDSTVKGNFFELDINEITSEKKTSQNIQISTASRTNETLEEASSSVTVFTRDQLLQLGIEDLFELLNYVQGYQSYRVVELSEYPEIYVRGRTSSNGILLMINGSPINDNFQGNVSALNRFIPLSLIRQVEVIRGPGSAIYGNNAFFGVVNVLTETQSNEVSVQLGSQAHTMASFNLNKEVSNRLDVSVNGFFLQDRGFEYSLPNARFTNDPRLCAFFNSQLRLADFTANFLVNRIDTRDFFLYSGNVSNGINQFSTTLLKGDLSFAKNISEKFSLQSSVYYNHYYVTLIGQVIPANTFLSAFDLLAGPSIDYSDYQVTLDFNLNIGENHWILGGINYRNAGNQSVDFYTNHVAPDFSGIIPTTGNYIGEIWRIDNLAENSELETFLNSLGLYLQYKIKIGSSLIGVVGGRFDHFELIGNTFNPRASLIYLTKFGSTFKFLYGSAFRAPLIRELFTNNLLEIGNKALKPEKIQSFELVYMQKIKTLDIQLSLFSNNLYDNIEEAQLIRNTYINSGNNQVYGIEGAISAQLAKSLDLRFTYTKNFDGYDPRTYASFGSYQINYKVKKWNFNINGIVRPEKIESFPNQSGYFLMNTKIKHSPSNKFGIYLIVLNFLGNRFLTFQEDFILNNGGIPNRGRMFRFGMEFKL